MELWQIRKHYGADKFWQCYLAYRIRNETNPEVGRFVEIRQLVENLCCQTEAEYEATVDALSWLVLERGTCCPRYRDCWRSMDRGNKPEAPNPGLNLLSAAAYFGYLPLAKRLISDGHCPTSDNDLFPPPIQLAAWTGNTDMLRLFQEHLPEFEEIKPPRWGQTWRGKTGPGSIKGAVLHGDMDLIRLAIYPPSRSIPHNTDFCGQPFGHVNPESEPGYSLRGALYNVKSWETFKYLDSFFEASILTSETSASLLLARYSELGNVEIVRQLLEAGADIHGGKRHNCNPLHIAVRYCQEDVVNLLLERGADPSCHDLQQRGNPLTAAARGGSLAIVRKLLDHGGKLLDWWPLSHAVRLEHTAMVELLLDHDIDADSSRSIVLKEAISAGLESMVQLLQQRGVALPS